MKCRKKLIDEVKPSSPAPGFSKLIRKAKELLVVDQLVPAYAGMPSNVILEGPKASGQYIKFETSSPPIRETPSRKIMDWHSVDIIGPDEPQREGALTFEQAQKEVSKLLKSKHSSHEYLSYEATKLCSAYPEVARYALHIMVGSCAEDFVFMPEEGLDHLHHRIKKHALDGKISWVIDELPTFRPIGKTVFRFVSRLWKKFWGTPETDSLNRPYFAHFYDPRNEQGMSLFYGDIRFESALRRIHRYWDFASVHYAYDKPVAFCALGHIIHLVQDLHVPAHVHNDIHGSSIFAGKIDSLEDWCARADYQHISRTKHAENIHIWDSGSLSPPKPNPHWNNQNIRPELTAFVNSFIAKVQRYRSVGARGQADDQRMIGKLSDEECHAQASVLIPLAIANSAQLIANFIDIHNRKP